MYLLRTKWTEGKFVCVGLDSDFSKVPEVIHNMTARQYKKGSAAYGALITFNRAIVDATYDVVCAYKPNSAFYEKTGSRALKHCVIQFLKFIGVPLMYL